MQPRKASLPLIFTLGLTACTVAPEEDTLLVDESDVGSAESSIMGGYPDADDAHSIAIAHLSGGGFGSCSGTLISPNVVLTAQHCVAQTSGNGFVQCGVTTFSPPYAPSELYITTRPSITTNIADYHRAREIYVAAGPEFCGNDVAVIILDDVVLEDEATWAVPRVDEQLIAFEEYYAIGHGNTSDNGGGGFPTRHRRDGLYTQCISNGCGIGSGILPSEWRGDAGICSGDSGGGSYDLFGRVHGVASRGAQGCASPVYGGVFAWGEWLKEITVYAASVAAIDPPPWATGYPTDPMYSHPVGAECSTVEECPSGACLNGYCTRLCTDAAYCPEGYTCRADGWCGQIPEAVEETVSHGDLVVSNGCSVSAPRQDPAPVPWKTLPLVLGAALWARRRR